MSYVNHDIDDDIRVILDEANLPRNAVRLLATRRHNASGGW
jgi:hypothetical protein